MPIPWNRRRAVTSVLSATFATALLLALPGSAQAQCCTCCEGYTCCAPRTSQTWTYIGGACDYWHDFWYEFEGCGTMHLGGTMVYGDTTAAYRDCNCNQHGAGHPLSPSCTDPPGQPPHDTKGWAYELEPEPLGGGHAWLLRWKIYNPSVSYEATCAPSDPCYGNDGEKEKVTYFTWVWERDVGCPCYGY